jgi:pimeloyl-ACP methyl ester carboxylesterase
MTQQTEIIQCRINGDGEPFETTVVKAESPNFLAIFAAGRGGNPTRHISLLKHLAQSDCLVVAPHFDMLTSSTPTASELNERIRRLERSIDEHTSRRLEVVGVGHSIGTVALLTMAGGKARTFDGDLVTFQSNHNFRRLALMAPPTGFFIETASLDNVRTNLHVRVGRNDFVTPPVQAALLANRLPSQTSVEVDDEADHFTYMDKRPPHVAETHPNAVAFRAALANEIAKFLTVRPTAAA